MASSLDNLKDVSIKLLPRGDAWRGNLLKALMFSIVIEFNRVLTLSRSFISSELYPENTTLFLNEYEADLALPEAFVDTTDITNEQRREQIVAKMLNRGGQNAATFILIARSLGYVASVDELPVSDCNVSDCEDYLFDETWRFDWAIRAPATASFIATCENATCEDPLELYTNEALEGMIGKYKPAYTRVHFFYEEVS